jgi:hypothetical protein
MALFQVPIDLGDPGLGIYVELQTQPKPFLYSYRTGHTSFVTSNWKTPEHRTVIKMSLTVDISLTYFKDSITSNSKTGILEKRCVNARLVFSVII